MRYIAVDDNPNALEFVPDWYKPKETCDKAVDGFLAASKFVSDWFITSKVIKNLFTDFYADENILYFNEDSSDTVLNYYEMRVLDIDLNCINIDAYNFWWRWSWYFYSCHTFGLAY